MEERTADLWSAGQDQVTPSESQGKDRVRGPAWAKAWNEEKCSVIKDTGQLHVPVRQALEERNALYREGTLDAAW